MTILLEEVIVLLDFLMHFNLSEYMKSGYKYPFLILMMILISYQLLGQKWELMDDSTYFKIVNNRFNTSNILIGSTVNFDVNHGDYKIVKYGIKPQAGYFVAKQWLLMGILDFQYSIATQDSGVGKSEYFKALAGPTIRYYLKPKPRSFFGQLSLFGGLEKQNSEESEYIGFNGTIYGAAAEFGLSSFFRRFELEILYGIKYSYHSYQNSFVADQSFQINISYIIQK